jgi:archaellum component FlaF (FlaF/FlaG flagellin family)
MSAVADSIHLIIVGVMFLIVIVFGAIVIVNIMKRNMRVRNANREIALLKMDLLSKQAHLENLISDSVEWAQSDLTEYDETLENSKVLKGKLDKGMIVADAKTKKLELMNETIDLFETMGKIRSYEDKMEPGRPGKGGRK